MRDDLTKPGAAGLRIRRGDAALEIDRAEYRALREGAALVERRLGEVVAEGADAVRFVHGLTTGDILKLPVGGSLHTLVTDDRGHVLSDAFACRETEQRIRLLCEEGLAVRVLEWLEAHRIADRVVLRTGEGAGHRELSGPLWRAALERAGGPPVPEDGSMAVWPDEPATLFQMRPGAALLRAGAAAMEGIDERLLKGGFVLVHEPAAERARIEDGRPRAGFEFDGDLLPMEIGLDHAVSYTKGCYAGQEVIARAAHRGHVRRTLAAVLIAAAVPERKTSLFSADREAGWTTSAVSLPGTGVLALACLRREYEQEGTELRATVSGRESPARVVALPFRAV